MQVQLVVMNEHHKGQVIPVNVSSFVIGRAEGCNLRSRSTKVSRQHCTIVTEGETVTVQDLGGGNGTFVNGNKIASTQILKDGDKLTVGTHLFIVSIKTGIATDSTNAEQNLFFELTPDTLPGPLRSYQDATQVVNLDVSARTKNPQTASPGTEVMFEIRLNGQRISLTKDRLFDLARRGSVQPDDLVVVAGTKVFADSIQGIVFGDESLTPPTPTPSPIVSPVSPPAKSEAQVPAASTTQEETPFEFQDFEDFSDEINAAASERIARVAQKESTFSALWKALDISFSRVYTVEGNDLVIHSIKALYYVVVVVCLLFIGFGFLEFALKWYEARNLLGALREKFVLLSVSIVGCTLFVVVVRILLEMLLLTWVESAKQDKDTHESKEK